MNLTPEEEKNFDKLLTGKSKASKEFRKRVIGLVKSIAIREEVGGAQKGGPDV